MIRRLLALAASLCLFGTGLPAGERVTVRTASDSNSVHRPKFRSVSGLLIEATQPYADLPAAWQVERFARRMRLDDIRDVPEPKPEYFLFGGVEVRR